MDILQSIAEEKIKEAMENGEFDDLPGKGKPLQLEDLSRIPEELRISYKILKNAGVLPEEMQLKKELTTLQGLLNQCQDEQERKELQREWTEKKLRYHLLMERRGRSAAFEEYEMRIEKWLNSKKEPSGT
ncbi:MAG: DUF1992 domain-containing protein [Thermicanus sp.]|nr:DUF1992 domain-containing protein [Thermicanus sp.]